MSFDLKLFSFLSQKPYRTNANGAQFFKVYPKKDKTRIFTLKVYIVTNEK